LWSMRENRYYFDERTFDLIPASIRSKNRHYGYTDLVLTREALRHRAWKLLSYKGLCHIDQFLRDFPDARLQYERAVWDSHTSLFAKGAGMTVFELLRMRLLGRLYFDYE
ncbi:MAG: hypothetical protein V1659_03230, partial [Candidatus Woesearchaeota archaeon]